MNVETMGSKRSWKMMHEEWEELAKSPGGHNKVVGKLREIIKMKGLKGCPKLVPLSDDLREELCIAEERKAGRRVYYVPYVPDLIITLSEKPEDRIFVEYVNTEGRKSENFQRCLRGMLALECVMRVRGLKARGFVLALRETLARKYLLRGIQREFMLDIMPLTLLVKRLEGKVEWHFV